MLRGKDEAAQVANAEYGMADGNYYGKFGSIGGIVQIVPSAEERSWRIDARVVEFADMPLNGRAFATVVQLNGGVSGYSGSFFGEFAAISPGSDPAARQEPAVQVRSDFRSTIFWQPDVVTDKDGKATVKVKFPDSLTPGGRPRAWRPRAINSASPRAPRARSSR